MMGSTEDPQDGAAVAATVLGAVIIYAVCRHLPMLEQFLEVLLIQIEGVSGRVQFPGCLTFERESEGGNHAIVNSNWHRTGSCTHKER
jgi:hypothetical protein